MFVIFVDVCIIVYVYACMHKYVFVCLSPLLPASLPAYLPLAVCVSVTSPQVRSCSMSLRIRLRLCQVAPRDTTSQMWELTGVSLRTCE